MKKNNKYYKIRLVIFVMIFLFQLSQHATAQTYGLKFNGYDYTLDKRTELNLTPDEFLKFRDEFEISFDYKTTRIIPNSGVGFFGYVFRIINQEDNNIDLISTPTPQIGLNIVVGRLNTIIPVKYPEAAIDNWIKIRVKFLMQEDRLIFYTPDTFYVKDGIGLKKQESFKIIFGINDYKQFKNSDVPSMSIRDIEVFEKGKPKYHWALNEKEGFWATDRIKGKKARATNPSWLSLNHQNWQKKFEHEFEGPVIVTSDPLNGNIYLVGKKELTIYSVQKNSLEKRVYKNYSSFLDNEYRVIFNSNDKRIYTYLVDKGPCYRLDAETGEWTEIIPPGEMQPYFRHHNVHFHGLSDIYLFGGYGLHQYNNTIIKIDLKARKWLKMPTNDSVFHPRYLAGLGVLNDTLYILGGFGSKSGNQMINPQSYFDLIGYSIRDSSLFARFEIPHLADDMIVGNSMWIDGRTRDYYALIFNKLIFNGNLQLIRGNLDLPEVKLVGNKIPFRFLDIRSFADLYFMPGQNKLYTYLSYAEDSTTQVAIYSIDYPPNYSVTESTNPGSKNSVFYFSGAVLLLFLGIYIIRKRSHRNILPENKIVGDTKNNIDLVLENNLAEAGKEDYQIIFFGGFQIFNKNHKDITSQFSPLLKELFLLIFLHSFKNDKGILSEKITELLWFEKSEKSARNNRAVNIAKLRTILKEIGLCELSKKTGYWKIIPDRSDIKIDYIEFLDITSSKTALTKRNVSQLIEITQKGSFLSDLHYDWLDDFKASVSDKIIDTLLKFGQSVDVRKEPEFFVHLADSVLNFDMVNEEAMILKCQAEYFMGNHSLAKTTYETFFKRYMVMYGQEYDRTFLDILEGNAGD